ncbi:AraC family transcriptional regulator [Paenibacillus sp. YYML68]|uniref:helix-turn-helix transcriptional regulator n=1 Tax=Paenibacillus sp. YYML68 TaxID=2909250 RepID=UPI002492272E|nr:AraC family transcriptional regulator [Paenibacillus sp. YYML68]
MKVSTNVNVQKEPYHLNYKKTSHAEHWEVFHFHQAMELLYVHEGYGTAIVGHRVFDFQPGTLLLFQPFQLHRLLVSDTFVRTVFMFDPLAVEPYLQPFPRTRQCFDTLWKQELEQQAFAQPAISRELEETLDRLMNRVRSISYDKQSEEYALALISCINTLSAYEFNLDRKRSHKRLPHHVEATILWLEDHYREKLTLDKLAAELHLSTYYLSHSFTQTTGSSITEYIMGRRMKEACRMLENTSMTVSTIALDIGFSNPSYFCRVFKEHTGTTPHKYREQRRG